MTSDPIGHGSVPGRRLRAAPRRRGTGGIILLRGAAGGRRGRTRPARAAHRLPALGGAARRGGGEPLARAWWSCCSGCASVRARPWWRVSPGAAAPAAREEPRLAEVTVSWRWPRDLVVRVRERESFLRVWGDPPLEVARDGVLLETREDLDPADLPLLTGALPPGLAPRRRLDLADAGDAWKEFLSLSEDEPEFWRDVSEIHYDGGRDFQVFLRQGRRVILWEAGINGDLKKTIPAILDGPGAARAGGRGPRSALPRSGGDAPSGGSGRGQCGGGARLHGTGGRDGRPGAWSSEAGGAGHETSRDRRGARCRHDQGLRGRGRGGRGRQPLRPREWATVPARAWSAARSSTSRPPSSR